jgi:hypothetical protein
MSDQLSKLHIPDHILKQRDLDQQESDWMEAKKGSSPASDPETVSTDRRYIDSIAPIVNKEISKYGSQYLWEWSMTLVPTPNGPQALSLFTMMTKSPILGGGYIVVVDPSPDLTVLSRPEAVAEIVSRLVLSLREAYDQALLVDG